MSVMTDLKKITGTRNMGGISDMYIIPVDDIENIEPDYTNEPYYKYDLAFMKDFIKVCKGIDKGAFQEDQLDEEGGRIYEAELEAKIPGLSPDLRKDLLSLPYRFCILIKDNNGYYRLFGRNNYGFRMVTKEIPGSTPAELNHLALSFGRKMLEQSVYIQKDNVKLKDPYLILYAGSPMEQHGTLTLYVNSGNIELWEILSSGTVNLLEVHNFDIDDSYQFGISLPSARTLVLRGDVDQITHLDADMEATGFSIDQYRISDEDFFFENFDFAAEKVQHVDVSGFNASTLNFSNNPVATVAGLNTQNSSYITFYNCGLTDSVVNQILTDVAEMANGYEKENGTLQLNDNGGSPNAAPTSAAAWLAYEALIALGWTVNFNTGIKTGLMSAYSFSSNGRWLDVHGSNDFLNSEGATFYALSGVYDYAYSPDFVTGIDHIEMPASAAVWRGATEWSIDCHIRALNTTANGYVLGDYIHDVKENRSLGLYYAGGSGNDGYFNLYYSISGGAGEVTGQTGIGTFTIDIGGTDYSHLVITFKDQTIKVYVNNSLVKEVNIGADYLFNPGGTWKVNQDKIGLHQLDKFYIDLTRLYKRALTASEVDTLYNSGNGTRYIDL